MNKYAFAFLALFALHGAASVCGQEVSDDEMKARMLKFVRPRCAGNPDDHFEPSMASCCRCETNRLVRLLKELVLTNDLYVSGVMMWQLGKYATPSDLPFLYSCSTNALCGDDALEAIMRIEGVTSNSVEACARYFSLTNGFPATKTHDRGMLCVKVLKDVRRNSELAYLRPRLMSVVLDFAEVVNTMHISLDEELILFDPLYERSKRRLRILRAVLGKCETELQVNYVTNAINELVAYPESELPE